MKFPNVHSPWSIVHSQQTSRPLGIPLSTIDSRLWTVFFSVVIGALALPAIVHAEEISVQARVNRRQVPLNGRLHFSLQINGTQNVQAPDLRLDGFTAQYLGPSTQIAIVNGRTSTSITHTYLLTPQREGAVTIGPLGVQVNGKTFQTDPIHVEVLPPAPVTSQGGWAGIQAPADEQRESQPLDEALQLQLGVDRRRAYLNQAIPIRLQLLIGGVAVRGIEPPVLQADGFLITPFQQPLQSEVMVSGQPTTLLEFTTVAVPIKTGARSLGPASVNCQIVQRQPARRRAVSPFGRDPFEDLFGGDSLFGEFFGSARLAPVTVHAEPVTIDVLPLPEKGKPTDFTGAVGRFALDATAVPAQVTVGEPVTITMTIEGDGNVESVTPPVLAADASRLKVYEPQTRPDAQGARGRPHKTFEQVLIPLDASVTEIPRIRFSYFDPDQGRYETLSKGPIPLRVIPAPVQERPTLVTEPQSASRPSQPEALGRDIVYIKEGLGPLRPVGWTWYGSAWRLLMMVAPAVLLALSEWLRRRRQRLAADPGAARASGAMKRALTHFRRARQLRQAGQVRECYDEIFRTVQRYVGDRFNRSSEGLTKAGLEESLRPRGASEELIRELCELFDRCDAARFAPAAAASDQVDATLKTTESILNRLERWKPA